MDKAKHIANAREHLQSIRNTVDKDSAATYLMLFEKEVSFLRKSSRFSLADIEQELTEDALATLKHRVRISEVRHLLEWARRCISRDENPETFVSYFVEKVNSLYSSRSFSLDEIEPGLTVEKIATLIRDGKIAAARCDLKHVRDFMYARRTPETFLWTLEKTINELRALGPFSLSEIEPCLTEEVMTRIKREGQIAAVREALGNLRKYGNFPESVKIFSDSFDRYVSQLRNFGPFSLAEIEPDLTEEKIAALKTAHP